MTEIELTRGARTNRVEARGHQDGAPRGQNIYCAAVSAMCLMLINALRAEGAELIEEEIHDGEVTVEAVRTDRVDAFFDMLAAGVAAMERTHPDRVTVRARGDETSTPGDTM